MREKIKELWFARTNVRHNGNAVTMCGAAKVERETPKQYHLDFKDSKTRELSLYRHTFRKDENYISYAFKNRVYYAKTKREVLELLDKFIDGRLSEAKLEYEGYVRESAKIKKALESEATNA